MGARQKLNQIHINVALFIAMIVGIVTESLVIFGIALITLVLVSVHAGEIRFSRRDNPTKREKRPNNRR